MKKQYFGIFLCGFILAGVPILNAKVIAKTEKDYLELLGSKKSIERQKAADWLGDHNAKSAEKNLIRLLRDRDIDVQKSAAIALGKIKSHDAVPHLIDHLSRNAATRPQVLNALASIQDERAIPAFRKYLHEKHAPTAMAALRGLVAIQGRSAAEDIQNALTETDDIGCQAMVTALGKLGDLDTAKVLLPLLTSSDSRRKCPPAAAEALGVMRASSARPFMMENMDSFTPEVKEQSIRALGLIGGSGVFEFLLKYKDDRNPKIRQAVLESMVSLGDRKCLPILQRALLDSDEGVRTLAVYGLNQFGVKTRRVEP